MDFEDTKKIIDALEDIAFQLSKINDNIGEEGLGERLRLMGLDNSSRLSDINQSIQDKEYL